MLDTGTLLRALWSSGSTDCNRRDVSSEWEQQTHDVWADPFSPMCEHSQSYLCVGDSAFRACRFFSYYVRHGRG